jgi:MerR family transcriptional regulator, thiopeptide resistance regulator
MQKITWKIGELASKSGITVRTLHHYHKIGLLVPSEFSETGHRLYTKSDISMLQQILSLKQMRLSLKEIQEVIENPSYNLNLLVKTQIENIKKQISIKEKLCHELADCRSLHFQK